MNVILLVLGAWCLVPGAWCSVLGAGVMDFTGDWDINSSVSGHVTEIITQTKVRHLPVIFAGDRDAAAARERAKPFMEVGHPVYILDSCSEADILALARKLKGKYDLRPKLEVTGPACVPAAAVYRKHQAKERLFTWVHAVDTPDGFTSEDLIHSPTTVRAPKAFARRFVRPASITKNAAGNWLVDFGREAFGWPEAKTSVAVNALAGEKLTDAQSVDVIPFNAIRSAKARVAASDGADFKRLVFKTEIYSRERCLSIPRELGEVMPMRYLEVPGTDSFVPTAENVRMVALEYPFDERESGFTSDNGQLNAIYDLCKYTIRGCTFGGIYIDGDRERLPYEADAYVTQLSNYAMSSDYEVSRATCDYLMPYPTWPTEYRQISILLNWSYWMWSGRDDLLEKHYAQLRDEKLMERYRRASDGLLETGGEMFHGAYEGAADMADWPPPERCGFEFRKVNAVVNAYYYIGLNQMTEIATHLGKKEDAAAFRARAAQVYDSYQKAFFDAKRGIYVDGQGATHASIHANAIAVVAGLVPEGKVKGVGDWLAGREMECSVYFAQHFLEALFKTGHGARAVALMTADNDRSWVGMIKAGATMTKESWNEGVKANIDWNHTWGTAALNVIARCLAGVTPAEAGFAKIRVAPNPAGLGNFDAKVPTAKGPVFVRYAHTGAKERLVVTVPASAVIVFRGETREVGPGTYMFGDESVELLGAPEIPAPRTDWAGGSYLYLMNEMRRAVRGQQFDFVVFGDSITMGWLYPEADKSWPGGVEVWQRHYGHLLTANFGVSGDRTEHVLWRIVKAGQVDGWKAKTIVLMIGINNLGQIRTGRDRSDSPDEAFVGARAIVEALKERHPESRLVVLGALPWLKHDGLAWTRDYNRLLQKLDDGSRVFVRDISSAFLASPSEQKGALFRDGLHPNPAGYEVFANQLDAILKEVGQK